MCPCFAIYKDHLETNVNRILGPTMIGALIKIRSDHFLKTVIDI